MNCHLIIRKPISNIVPRIFIYLILYRIFLRNSDENNSCQVVVNEKIYLTVTLMAICWVAIYLTVALAIKRFGPKMLLCNLILNYNF